MIVAPPGSQTRIKNTILAAKSGMFKGHCGLKNILLFLSPTPKTNGGHENRAKSVWESSFIEILDLPPWP